MQRNILAAALYVAAFRALRPLTLALLGLVLCGPCLAAERWTPDNDTCNQQSTTYAIAGCIDARSKVWDQRLNQAYQALLAMLATDPDGKPRIDALKAAQRAWLRYRQANCAFYETTPGTIRMIEVAECARGMTQERALELQRAGPQ